MKTVEERLKEYEPLWENWTYTGNFLGEGAMSSVFEIESTAMGLREVAALKIITVKKDINGEVKIPKTALNEIKILRALSGCPNIINYHDSTQRKIYDKDKNLESIDLLIKMEELQSLSERKKLDEKEVIKLAKDMCTALIYASKRGVIHRDIKPQNIFVDNDGIYKLGDFGIAKIVSEFSNHYTMNIGTMAYTAPEICNGKSTKYDISSDIYSLGLVLYVFLNNGYLPFVNTTASINDAIAKRFSGATFPSPENGSKALKRIVMRACNADVEKRYKTPQEMLEELQSLSSGGKKMIVDPFATLDANIDVAEFLESKTVVIKDLPTDDTDSHKTRTTDSLGEGKTFGEKKKSGLRINMGKSTSGKSGISVADSFSGASELKTTVVSSFGVEKTDSETIGISKPGDIKPMDVKPMDVKPMDVKPMDVKPMDVKPMDVKPVDVKPVDVKLADKPPVGAPPDDTDISGTIYMKDKPSIFDRGYVPEEKVSYSADTVYMPMSGSGGAGKSEMGAVSKPTLVESEKSASKSSGLRISMGPKSSGEKLDVNKEEKDREASQFLKAPPSL